MLNILIVGRPKTGKTTRAKSIAASAAFPLIVSDVYGEWGQRPRSLREVLDIAEKRIGQPSTFVFEEATGMIGHEHPRSKNGERLVSHLIGRRHRRHVNVLVFHSLRSVPVWVMDFCDELVIGKTADRPTMIDAKFKGWTTITDALRRANAHPSPFHFEEVSIFGT